MNLNTAPPDPRARAPRPVVAALIGAEAGAAIGLLVFGGYALVPLALAAAGAATGPVALTGVRAVRLRLYRLALRQQLRADAAG